ncbi:MAG TPA: hypothetical protein EYH07_13500 [Kiloniellaceae bacterium]|nr:hypothetical protein [Kiloniellaceae bacterium]
MLDHEPYIRQRLEGIPGCRGVHGMVDFDSVSAAGKQLPAIPVGADGYRVAGRSGQNKGVQIAVRWLIVVAGRNVARIRDGAPARGTVSQVAGAAMSRLAGWRPPDCQEFRPEDGYRPIHEAGLLLFPLAFTSRIFIEATP